MNRVAVSCLIIVCLAGSPARGQAPIERGSLADLATFRKPLRQPEMVVPGYLWIDAEDFADYGQWRLDTQFVDEMGSAYLLAGGVGVPIGAATTSFPLAAGGRYRLWVRVKNWLPPHNPGRFAVKVNGVRSPHVFGEGKEAIWQWESAGDFELPAGTVELALEDLTGYFARCDAMILTSDLGYRPPDELEAYRREWSRLTGVALEAEPAGDYEVVVVGAGAAGCSAAIAAARQGAKTALVHDRPILGGSASTELGVGISGASVHHANARESGLIEEAGLIRAYHTFPKMSEAFHRMADAEPNLTVLYNQRVNGAQMASADRIARAVAVDTLTGRRRSYGGKLFIDCTGDGWLGYYAGAQYRLGRESRDEFGEDLAPAQADKVTMSGCIMGNLTLSYRAVDVGRPSPYTPPVWAAEMPPADKFGRTLKGFVSGQWWLEHAGDIDDLYQSELARDELIRITFGYWDYVKNAWPDREQAARYALAYVPHMNAKRETRRLVGDYLMTQADVQQGTMFADRISYGGWPIDVHHPRGIFSGPEGPYYSNPRVPIYSIPYRALYSANIANLLFAGRDASVTHIALGTVRVQGTLATLGQAAGTAAAMAVRYGESPRQLGERHIDELQQTLLRDDQYIPELKNADPSDLAREAVVTASSTARYTEFGRQELVLGQDTHELTMPRAMMLPRGLGQRLDTLTAILTNRTGAPVELEMHLRKAAALDDFSSTTDVAVARATVPPGGRKPVEFRFDQPLDGAAFWVWLPRARGVWWELAGNAPGGARRGYGGGGDRPWTVVPGHYYALYAEPPLRFATDYRPENVIDGVTRSVGDASHLWVSDASAELPQWLELKLSRPSTLDTVELTFDTDLNLRSSPSPAAPQCVRDYRLEYFAGGGWSTLADERDNYLRRRVHRFAPVEASRVRLVVEATHGDPSARVFAVRIYHEAANEPAPRRDTRSTAR